MVNQLISVDEARALVFEHAQPDKLLRRTETIFLEAALDRVLARDVVADRDYPPFRRSTRDGYAVHSSDCARPGARLRVVGEVPAGTAADVDVPPGACVEIMTGAPLPTRTDAVVMVEHVSRQGDHVVIENAAHPGEHFVPAGAEIAREAVAVAAGSRLGPSGIGLLAQMGHEHVSAFAVPRVAVVPTGSEIVEVRDAPGPSEIRNSNGHALAAQAWRAGAIPLRLPIARDTREALAALVNEALARGDMLVLCGGISKGKYDLVADVLDEAGAKWHFRGVAMRPGKPVAFGHVGRKPFFALPGNPVSAAVTFELFVRPSIDLATGIPAPQQRTVAAKLQQDYRQRATDFTVFAPARIERGPDVEAVALASQGSGDTVTLGKADAFIVVPPGTESLQAGSVVTLLPK